MIEALHALRRDGTEIIYVPGNHDRPARPFCGLMLPAMQVRRRAIHVTADGRRLLVVHGDDYDSITHFGGLQERFGDWLYYRILTWNQRTNALRRRFGLRYWSLAEFLKRQRVAVAPGRGTGANCATPALGRWQRTAFGGTVDTRGRLTRDC